MTKYEFLMLTTPGITGDEMGNLEKQFENLLKQFKGSFVSFDRWGKCRLAYPVKHHDYGVYYLARFEMEQPQEFLKEVKLLLDVKYNDLVMRTVTVKVGSKAYTNFRPDAVEDMPTRNVDQFLRDNKMEGLIGKKESASSAPVKEEAAVKSIESLDSVQEAPAKESDANEKSDDNATDEGASA